MHRVRGFTKGVAFLGTVAAGGVVAVGAYDRATVKNMECHERFLNLKESWLYQSHTQYKRTTHAVQWNDHELSFDRYTRSDKKPIGTEKGKYTLEPNRAIVMFAPPSFVSSRSTFVGLFSWLKCSTLVVTEVAGYGINGAIGSGADELTPAALESSMEAILEEVVQQQHGEPVNVIATGHTGMYALKLAERRPELLHKVALLNPTYRGPLPTAEFDSGKDLSGLKSFLFTLFGLPIVGFGINHVFSSYGNIKQQLLSHVYSPEYVTRPVIQRNVEWSRSGYPLSKAAFLVGHADGFKSREELTDFLSNSSNLDPTRVRVYMGFTAPDTNKGDLDPLQAAGFRLLLTVGALRSYVEYPKDLGCLLNNYFFLTPGQETWDNHKDPRPWYRRWFS